MTTPMSVANVDLSDPDVFVDGPPHEVFRRLREQAPVSWNTSSAGDDFWSVTRHADITTVTKDWETYSSALGSITIRPGTLVPRDMEQMVFIMMDPPQHRKHRHIVQEVFSPGAVAAREDDIRGLAAEHIDRVVERGECDAVNDLAVDLPLLVIANLLGVPESDRDQLFEWTNILVAADDPSLRASDDVLLQALGEMGMYIMGLVAERRKNPQDDILSRLILAEVDGESLNDLELVGAFSLLLGGGNETTRNTIVGTMRAMTEFPEERRRLIADPALMPSAVEEMLRFHTPFVYMARTASRDTELNGTAISKGEKVVMWLAAGNRDPEVFEDPDRFDIGRGRSKHQAFGAGGRHHCVGHQLARLELRIFFEELLKRIPDFELAGEPERVRSTFIHGYKSMPIRFTPSASGAAR